MADPDLTSLIALAREGDSSAFRHLFEAAYEELRGLAHVRLNGAERPGHLDTSALVHEAFMRFAQADRVRLADRKHFFVYASRVMRSVIIDTIRESQAARRGGGQRPVTLTTGIGHDPTDASMVLKVHESLAELADLDPRMAQVVEMRFFGGCTEEEIADSLSLSARSVRRDWSRARWWLADALG